MKIDTVDQLERVLELMNKHGISVLEIGDLRVTKNPDQRAMVLHQAGPANSPGPSGGQQDPDEDLYYHVGGRAD